MGNSESNLAEPHAEPTQQPMTTETAPMVLHETNAQRQRRHSSISDLADDPWWWEIENENLILDQVPNVTAIFSESESVPTSAVAAATTETQARTNVCACLSKISENVTVTLSENHNDNNNNHGDDQFDVAAKTIADNKSETEASNRCRSVSAETETLRRGGEQSLEEFKEELRVKRLARQTAVQDLRDEISSLRRQLATEQRLTRSLRESKESSSCSSKSEDADIESSNVVEVLEGELFVKHGDAADDDVADEDDHDPEARSRHANIELANAQLALQLANADNLSLRTELGVVQKQVGTLKEVIACCKQMLTVKEEQCTQLKAKLTEIETSFSEREMKIMSNNLRQEYERQLVNIRQLRQLYEERQRVAAAEYENLQRLISIKKDELIAEQEKTKNFEERNQTLVKEVETANNELATLREECNEHKFEKKTLKEEMGAVNTLFSQMVMGFNGKNNLDIDRLATMLEENRALLNEMAQREGNCSDGATLPKLLFELVEQAAIAEAKAAVTAEKSRSTTPMPHNGDDNVDVVDDNGNEQQQCDATETVLMQQQGEQQQDVQNVTTTAASADADDVAALAGDDGNAYNEVSNEMATPKVLPGGSDDVTDCAVMGATAINYDKDKECAKQNNNNNNNTTNSSNNGKKHRKRNGVATGGFSVGVGAAAAAAVSLKCHEPEIMGKVTSTQEIIGNLPKVWKVLMELLSHHKIEQVQFEENGTGEDCYKSVETTNGIKTELSVSKTYIKLKDLILEKKSLVKETNRLKTLNCHLEHRLNEQEKRLSAVSLELTKTWHLVGKMQRQHRQLHTQEQILRYQLQQKRRLLCELKDELEYCRRKWAKARAINDESQEQCDDLRREFARRKLEDAANHSAESGYSDSGPQSDDEDRAALAAAAAVVAASGAVTDDVNVAVGTSAAAAVVIAGVNVVGGNCRRKHLKEHFEHTRKIKRMQSTSPGRAAGIAYRCSDGIDAPDEIVLRWNSAPPTCGWREGDDDDDDEDDEIDDDEDDTEVENEAGDRAAQRGAVPKPTMMRNSRSKQRRECMSDSRTVELATTGTAADVAQREERASRIQKLEEQCKSLIQQVLETSGNRERLEVQLCRYQDEIAPVQHAVPLDEYINRRRFERMTRASSMPATGTLTPREEEYTRKRSERLGRLEEESRQLMSRIKRTTDRGHYLRCSLDRIRRAPSHEGSFESNTEEEPSTNSACSSTAASVNESTVAAAPPAVATSATDNKLLTADEEAYTARRAARLQRLEEESKQLLTQLSKNTQRGEKLGDKLDALHERYTSEEAAPTEAAATNSTIEKRLEDIEKVSANRAERLRILEAEGKELLERLTNTSERGTEIINRIRERETSRLARNEAQISATPEVETAASALPSTLNNVACSSIVAEELGACVTVTTTPSQIAKQQQGAIPKSKPSLQLCAAARQQEAQQKAAQAAKDKRQEYEDGESLEDMVRRLRALHNSESEAEAQTSGPTADKTVLENANALEPQQPAAQLENNSDDTVTQTEPNTEL